METPDRDRFRMEYRPLTSEQSLQVLAVKGDAASLSGFLETLGESREISLAQGKLEEAVFWATKHITRPTGG